MPFLRSSTQKYTKFLKEEEMAKGYDHVAVVIVGGVGKEIVKDGRIGLAYLENEVLEVPLRDILRHFGRHGWTIASSHFLGLSVEGKLMERLFFSRSDFG